MVGVALESCFIYWTPVEDILVPPPCMPRKGPWHPEGEVALSCPGLTCFFLSSSPREAIWWRVPTRAKDQKRAGLGDSAAVLMRRVGGPSGEIAA